MSRSALTAGHPIAMIGQYNGEYHFEGRLRDVHIDMITAQGAPAWLRAHHTGLLLRYDRDRQAPVIAGTVAQHPFRNGWATLAASLPGATMVNEAPSATE